MTLGETGWLGGKAQFWWSCKHFYMYQNCLWSPLSSPPCWGLVEGQTEIPARRDSFSSEVNVTRHLAPRHKNRKKKPRGFCNATQLLLTLNGEKHHFCDRSVGWVNPAETVSEGRQKGPKEGSTLLGHWREAKVRNAFRLPKGPGYSWWWLERLVTARTPTPPTLKPDSTVCS